MGSTNSKVECLIKPAQSGKTRTIQEKIKYYELIVDTFGRGGAINIIICSNNKKLVEQTTSRMTTDLFETASSVSDDSEADDFIRGSCFSWTSGTKKNNVSVEHLSNEIKEKRVTMIVCCAHKKRLTYLHKLIMDINCSRCFDGTINVWIDEADESISLWSNPSFDVTHLFKVDTVTLVSATFNSIVKKYGRIKVIPLPITHPETYHKIGECEIIEDCTAGNSIEYLKAVFTKYEDVLKKPGMRLFAPGDIEIASHDKIAEFLGEQGFAVMVLNGKRKCIIVPGKDEPINIDSHIDENCPEEIGKIMTRIYLDNRLYEYPFAITGQMCLGRGLTFQNDKFLFDFGIMSNIRDDATAYQCICRMAGNIKQHSGYKRSTIVTTTHMKSVMLRQESIAIQLAKMVHDNKLNDVGDEEIHVAAGGGDSKDLEKMREIGQIKRNNKRFDDRLNQSVKIEPFSSLEELQAFWKQLGNKNVVGLRLHHDTDGKIKSSIGKTSQVQKSSEIKKWLNESGVASWGVALTDLLGPSDLDPEDKKQKYIAAKGKMLASVKVGYEGDVPTFFLRYVTIPDYETDDNINPFE
jgi:hypothetical protein